ncbi:MAG TPA: tRNA 2-thiouridine(34) synthase MnmA [Candidatus Xenobia bacterium]|jgi:tRNA-specific 2-thiouridylase
MSGQRIVVAMSGGVDSSAVAAMLVDQGYDCIGVTMRTFPTGASPSTRKAHGCCTLQEARDAQRVAAELGIPHYLLNYEDVFQENVIDNFLDEYVSGRTPNPCVRCNQFIKFDALREFATRMEASHVASGHYARINHNRRWRLYKGQDPHKDQSYVLYVLTQEQLAHTMFPLAGLTKAETRETARRLGLHLADKAESYEVCFVPDGDYLKFISTRRPDALRPGPVRHVSGEVLGEHRGIAFHTIGQRRGLGIAAPRPLYVIRIEVASNTLWVGEEEHLHRSRFLVKDANWIAFDRPPDGLLCEARIRYNSPEGPARIHLQPDGRLEVELRSPQRAVAPGQSAVFYQEDEVLGGGIIEKVLDTPAMVGARAAKENGGP